LKNWSLPPVSEAKADRKGRGLPVHHLSSAAIREDDGFALALKLREERRTGAGASTPSDLIRIKARARATNDP